MHPIEAAKDEPGSHNIVEDGNIAIDVPIEGLPAYEMVRVAMELGVPGVGVNQHDGGRMIHLDWAAPRTEAPRPRIWTYT